MIFNFLGILKWSDKGESGVHYFADIVFKTIKES